jgi:hypothetical protein
MGNQVPVNKPTAAYVLSLIGGILGLIVGLILLVLGFFVGALTFGIGLVVYGAIGIWCLICSVIVIVSASKLNSEPMEHTKWGVLILIFSIIGLGSLLGLIGGILALAYKPEMVAGQQPAAWGQPAQSANSRAINRICPQCGRVIDDNVKFCPHCGKQLG